MCYSAEGEETLNTFSFPQCIEQGTVLHLYVWQTIIRSMFISAGTENFDRNYNIISV